MSGSSDDRDFYPQVSKMIPDFRLETADGREFRMSSFRGRRNLVLVFPLGKLDAPVRDLLSGLAVRKQELAEEEAQVFVISPKMSPEVEGAAAGLAVLVDNSRDVSRRYGAECGPALYITDRYGEIYAAYRTEQGTPLPDIDDVMASLRHVNAMCPE